MKNFKFLIFALLAVILTAFAVPAVTPSVQRNKDSPNFAPAKSPKFFAGKSVPALDQLVIVPQPVYLVSENPFAAQRIQIQNYAALKLTISYDRILPNKFRKPPERVKLE